MKDQDVEKLISQALDGELDAAGRAMIIRKEGPMFSDTREEFKQFGEQLREGATEGMPTAEAMWQDVQREIQSGAEPADRKSFWQTPWPVAVAAALALAIGLPLVLKDAAVPVQATATVEYLSTDLPGADIGSYVLPDSEMTVIWVFEEESNEG